MIRVSGLTRRYGDFTAVDNFRSRLAGVQSVEQLESGSAYQYYALTFNALNEAVKSAPSVATALLNEECWPYGLKPEQRSLESLFIEASAQVRAKKDVTEEQ